MKIPEKISICFRSSDQQPLGFLPVRISLKAYRKNDYNLDLKMTSDSGAVELTERECREEIARMQRLFVMDYSSSLEECLPYIEIHVLSEDDLKRIINLKRDNSVLFECYYPDSSRIDFILQHARKCKSSFKFKISEDDLRKNGDLILTIA